MSALVLIFLALTYPLLTGGMAEHWDCEAFFAPFYHYVASLARAGSLLRWNPFCNGGSPDFAEPQVGAASPITLLFGLLAGPGPLGFHLYWLCLWLFGGLGMYVLARALGAPPWGALVSALGFVLSGFYLGHAEHTSVVYTFSFLPWTLWRVRAAMRTGRPWPACEAGALWGLSALAGNPAVHFPAALFIGLTAPAFLPALPPGEGAARWRAARTYALTMGLLAVVGVIVLLPAYGAFRHEAAGYSDRSLPLARALVLHQGYGFGWLTALFTPVFVPFGERLPAWEGYDVSARLVYCGAPVLVLAGFAAWRGTWREWTILAAGLFCLGLAMGTTLPLRSWLYDLVPPTRFIRNTATFRGCFVLAAATLAAVGAARVEAIRQAPDAARRLRPLAVAAGVGVGLAGASYLWIQTMLTPALAAQVPRSAPWHLGCAWLGTLLTVLAAIRWPGFRRWLPGVLAVLAAADLAGAFGYSRGVVFEARPSMPALAAGPVADPDEPSWNRAVGNYVNDNIILHQPTFMNYSAMNNSVQEDWSQRPGMSQVAAGSRRVWFAADVPTVPPTMKVYEAFRRRGNALRALPMVRHERADLLHPSPVEAAPSPAVLNAVAAAPAARLVPAEVLAYHANDLTLRVTAPTDGYVLVTERWARSWETTVNGQPVTTDAGDFLFRLVPVRAGESVIAMRYRVGWWYTLVTLSWTVLAVVAAVSLRRSFRRSAPSIPPVGPFLAQTEPAVAVTAV